jgi:ABC-type Fe3+-siderophore transport system permease subunit
MNAYRSPFIVRKDVVKSGISFGSVLAIVISYTAHKSVLWAIIHGFFSWLYVVYFLLTR